jgi:TATA-binding protein-associated factor
MGESEGPSAAKEKDEQKQKGGQLALTDIDATNQPQPHRALLFCQMNAFMDMVIQQVLNRFGIKHLCLRGTIPSKERIQIVDQFNSDPSYRVMILTTSVGGLGLTLTGADVVIFLEHDWNPMRDLQAMDRAHRLGQTRTVNVYRLIMRDTIEDNIMNLQRFK